jgi:hypothetical protein
MSISYFYIEKLPVLRTTSNLGDQGLWFWGAPALDEQSSPTTKEPHLPLFSVGVYSPSQNFQF